MRAAHPSWFRPSRCGWTSCCCWTTGSLASFIISVRASRTGAKSALALLANSRNLSARRISSSREFGSVERSAASRHRAASLRRSSLLSGTTHSDACDRVYALGSIHHAVVLLLERLLGTKARSIRLNWLARKSQASAAAMRRLRRFRSAYFACVSFSSACARHSADVYIVRVPSLWALERAATLRETAFKERCKIHDLVMQGIDLAVLSQ